MGVARCGVVVGGFVTRSAHTGDAGPTHTPPATTAEPTRARPRQAAQQCARAAHTGRATGCVVVDRGRRAGVWVGGHCEHTRSPVLVPEGRPIGSGAIITHAPPISILAIPPTHGRLLPTKGGFCAWLRATLSVAPRTVRQGLCASLDPRVSPHTTRWVGGATPAAVALAAHVRRWCVFAARVVVVLVGARVSCVVCWAVLRAVWWRYHRCDRDVALDTVLAGCVS